MNNSIITRRLTHAEALWQSDASVDYASIEFTRRQDIVEIIGRVSVVFVCGVWVWCLSTLNPIVCNVANQVKKDTVSY